MSGYIFDTSVISPLVDSAHFRHDDVRAAVGGLDARSTKFMSAITVAEVRYGVHLAKRVTGSALPNLLRQLAEAHEYAVLEVTRHTASAYAELKANLASKYLVSALKRDRPRWVEDWIDKATGRRLQVDENDLWICAQGKERDLTVVTADRRMSRISNADFEVRLHIV